MLCFRSIPFFLLILPLSLFISSTFFSFSHGSSQLNQIKPSPIFSGGAEKEYGVVVPSNTRRSVAETVNKSSLILAAERTYRRDPFERFKSYSGGWNISNVHYWASVGFTAAPLFVIAGIWFVVFGISLCLICLCYCCCRREPYGYSRVAYALSLIFLIVFTIAAIIGCIVLYMGQGQFHSSTTNILGYVVDQADTTAEKLRSVSYYLSAAKKIGVGSLSLPEEIQSKIDNVQSQINGYANILSDKTAKNKDVIKETLNSVRLALIILAAVMLLLAFLGFLFSIFGLQCLVYSLVIVGWILVTLTFILCGIFLLLHNVVADTCVAMDQYVQHPTAHTALDDLIPCVDNATAQEYLLRSQDVTYQLVSILDTVINTVANVDHSPDSQILFYNQSGPLMPLLCNPFNSDRTSRQCTAGEVDMDNATRVWKNYVCQTANQVCTTPGRVTPGIYEQMTIGVNLTYGLYHYGPFLISLRDCSFVRQTFNTIVNDHCPGLRVHSEWIYIGLVMVSAAVMLSLIFWVIYARERRHRVYTKQFMTGSYEGHIDREKAR